MKLTADEAYKKFYSSPLVKAAGVDHASFCAGFDTCAEQYEGLLGALQAIMKDDMSDIRYSLYKKAQRAIAKAEGRPVVGMLSGDKELRNEPD